MWRSSEDVSWRRLREIDIPVAGLAPPQTRHIWRPGCRLSDSHNMIEQTRDQDTDIQTLILMSVQVKLWSFLILPGELEVGVGTVQRGDRRAWRVGARAGSGRERPAETSGPPLSSSPRTPPPRLQTVSEFSYSAQCQFHRISSGTVFLCVLFPNPLLTRSVIAAMFWYIVSKLPYIMQTIARSYRWMLWLNWCWQSWRSHNLFINSNGMKIKVLDVGGI